jgi:hypothetical protein
VLGLREGRVAMLAPANEIDAEAVTELYR